MGYRKLAVIASYDYDRRTDHGALYSTSFAQLHWKPKDAVQSFCFPHEDRRAVPAIQERYASLEAQHGKVLCPSIT